MGKTPLHAQDIGNQVQNATGSFVYLSKTTAPYTTVVNRALMTDLTQDLRPRSGIERIHFYSITECLNEFGPANERVFKPSNDIHDRIRLYGIDSSIAVDTRGPNFTNSSGSMEITFYGTGLNVLVAADGSGGRSLKASTDGGALGAELWLATSPILFGRNNPSNQIFAAVTGLALGVHTVRLAISAMRIYGVEILNTSGTSPNLIQIPAGTSYSGGRALVKSTPSVLSYNTGFETTSPGSRGGRVSVYQKNDGTIGHEVQPCDSQTNYPAALHTNEEVIGSFHFREFGMGRDDDFSRSTSTNQQKAYTLDDGVTTLTGSDCRVVSGSDPESIHCFSAASYIAITFVGTGLDILRNDEGTVGSSTLDAHTITVDGTVLGTSITGTSLRGITPLIGGLPYGTHVVRITRSVNVNVGVGISKFIVYGPKKPTIPSDAIELGSYFLLSDYGSPATESPLTISAGVLRKQIVKEGVYGGSWTIDGISVANGPISGFQIHSETVGSYVEYFFVGTGIDFRVNSEGSMTGRIYIDGSTDGVHNVLSGYTLTNTGGSLVTTNLASQGDFSGNTGGGARITINGMTYGRHSIRVKLQASTGGGLYPEAFDVITPIHSPAVNSPVSPQNTLRVGSFGVTDERKFSEDQITIQNPWGQSKAITSGDPTSSVSGPASPVLREMIQSIRTNGGPIRIEALISLTHDTSNGDMDLTVYLDGTQIDYEVAMDFQTGGLAGNEAYVTYVATVPVPAGDHVVYCKLRTNTGNVNSQSVRRKLYLRELT